MRALLASSVYWIKQRKDKNAYLNLETMEYVFEHLIFKTYVDSEFNQNVKPVDGGLVEPVTLLVRLYKASVARVYSHKIRVMTAGINY